MAKFDVAIPVKGMFHIVVEADNETEAEDLALDKWDDMTIDTWGVWTDDPMNATVWVERDQEGDCFVEETDDDNALMELC